MIYPVYALYDAAARAYLAPQLNSTDDAAKRDLALALSQSAGVPLGFSPKDFSLYRIGTFDNDSGILTPAAPAILVCHASSLVEVSQNDAKS